MSTKRALDETSEVVEVSEIPDLKRQHIDEPASERVAPIIGAVKVITDEADEVVSENNESGSDSEIILLESDGDSDSDGEEKKSDELTKNEDFIGFNFSDEDEGENEADLEQNDQSIQVSSLNSKSNGIGPVNPNHPWIRSSDHTKQLEVSDWLTREIKDFVRYVSPSKDEVAARNGVFQRLSGAVSTLWPDAELHCFGSYATDLYLPGSDIDTVVISPSHRYTTRRALFQLSSYIRSHNLGKHIETISHTRVPIIKLVDPDTGYHIDISFERENGLTAAHNIISWIKTTPGLRELVIIVKQFLANRQLNEVHTGGLGGFSIICLVYSFLSLHPRIVTNSIDPMQNLGVLLIEFFELYGFNFDYDEVAIAFKRKRTPIYVRKMSNQSLLNRNPFSLAIQDPEDSTNNVSRSSFNLRDIKRSFGGAFELLVNKCYEMNDATYKQRLGQTILGSIVTYNGKSRDFEDARGEVSNYAFQIASGNATRDDILNHEPEEEDGHESTDSSLQIIENPEIVKVDSSPSIQSISSSNSGSDADAVDYATQFDRSQAARASFNSSLAAKTSAHTSKQVSELMGLKDDEDDDNDDSNKGTPKENLKQAAAEADDFKSSDEDDDYDPSAQVSAALVAEKKRKREYWLQKGAAA